VFVPVIPYQLTEDTVSTQNAGLLRHAHSTHYKFTSCLMDLPVRKHGPVTEFGGNSTARLAPSVWASGRSGSMDDQLERLDTLPYVIYDAIGTSCVSQVVVFVFVLSGRFFGVPPQELGPINCALRLSLRCSRVVRWSTCLGQPRPVSIDYSFQGDCMGPVPTVL
jgi:hypothetical protein